MKTTRKITLKYYQRNPFKLNDLVLASLEIMSIIIAFGIGIWMNVVIR